MKREMWSKLTDAQIMVLLPNICRNAEFFDLVNLTYNQEKEFANFNGRMFLSNVSTTKKIMCEHI